MNLHVLLEVEVSKGVIFRDVKKATEFLIGKNSPLVSLVLEIIILDVCGKEFSDLARQYSEDIGSASEGGSLGWIRSGQMVPEFENTMDSTEISAISIPFKSQFGWHVLKVNDRRKKDVTDEIQRNKIAEFLHNRKYQEELDAWLQKIRDEAFVDIK